MNNRPDLPLPAESEDSWNEIEHPRGDAMQQWLNNARASTDARDRLAVSGGVSHGAFGRLNLSEFEENEAANLKHAA